MWIQGAILNVCGSILVNLAANLLKLAHNVEESDKISPNKQEITTGLNEALKYGALLQCCTISFGSPVYASKLYWRLGAFLFAAGSVINFLSLSMAAQSLLATLGGVQFVSNIFFAKCILGEKVTRRGLIATLVIVLGLTIAVSFSDHVSTRYSSSTLIALYDTKYITFIVSVAATLIISECTYIVYTASEKAGKPLFLSSIVRPVTYSMVSATVGTQSVLQSKCLAELLRTDITGTSNTAGNGRSMGNDLFANTLFYIVLTAFLIGMAFWLYRLNNALKLFDGLVIIPIIQVRKSYNEIRGVPPVTKNSLYFIVVFFVDVQLTRLFSFEGFLGYFSYFTRRNVLQRIRRNERSPVTSIPNRCDNRLFRCLFNSNKSKQRR
jgi:magnesium transporter